MGELIEELREAADQERHASTYLADLMSRAADALSSQSVRVKELEGMLAEVELSEAELEQACKDLDLHIQSAQALAQRRGKALEPFARIAELHLGAPFDEEHVVHLKDAHGFIAELFVRPFREASRALHLPEVEG
jgi:hypothetical protein